MNIPEESWAKMWDAFDWCAAKNKLAGYQQKLTVASFRKDSKGIKRIQRKIVNDLDMKCLAVRHVVQTSSMPGIDGVKWRTSAEMMHAAMSLSPKNYRASPLHRIIVVDKKGKERRIGVPTYFDRSMNVLFAYSLAPVAEALGDRKSFAFRHGRSTQDAHAYVLESLKGSDGPSYVVYADIKTCYANIQHSWVLKNVPMEKTVLAEMLDAGIIFSGEFYPAEEQGISEGSSLSPHIANIVLDGLQKHIFEGLHGEEYPDDYAEGNMIRFMDDIIVTVRTEESGRRVIRLINEFLADRGLALSNEKTKICHIDEGFTFLSRTYVRKNEIIYSYPSDASVDRFIGDLRDYVLTFNKSQRELIKGLNSKLKGWATYHRCCDAGDAFRKVDVAVQTALWESAVQKHPCLQKEKIKAKYWYKEKDGRYCYALPDNKSIRVIRLADTVLLVHNRVDIRKNPYVDKDYSARRTRDREIENVTGAYRAIWERQNGRCYYCGRKILSDQPRTVVPLKLDRPPSVRNSVYVHSTCALSDIEIIRTDKDLSYVRPFDIMSILTGIAEREDTSKRKKPINEQWKYYRLKKYFEECTSASVTLTFKKIEEIGNVELPPSAYNNRYWWYPRKDSNRIAEAWITEGYLLKKINMENKRITLHRAESRVSKLHIPEPILQGMLPDDAVFEIDSFLQYIIDKYGL